MNQQELNQLKKALNKAGYNNGNNGKGAKPRGQKPKQGKKKQSNGNNQQGANFSKPSSAPVQITVQSKKTNPKIGGSAKEPLIENKELISTLTTASTGLNFYEALRLRLNPGSETTFPWLSQVARSWEFYRFEELEFHYLTRCTTDSSGALLLAPDYDAADTAPVSEIEAAQMVDAVETAFWKNCVCKLSPLRLNALYKRRTNMDDARFTLSAQDQKTLDAGQLHVCLDGSGLTGFQLGKLWVKYKVRLMNPQPVTLPPKNMGGAETAKVAGININNASTFATRDLSKITTDVPLLFQEQYIANGTNPNVTFPGNNLLQFAKDWQGLLTNQWLGSGLTSQPDFQINGATDATKCRKLGSSILTGAGATSQWDITARAGDILGVVPSQLTGTSISSLSQWFGSAAAI